MSAKGRKGEKLKRFLPGPHHCPLHVVGVVLPHYQSGYTIRTQLLAAAQYRSGMCPRVVGRPDTLISDITRFIEGDVGRRKNQGVVYYGFSAQNWFSRKVILFCQTRPRFIEKTRFQKQYVLPKDAWDKLIRSVVQDVRMTTTVVHAHTPHTSAARGIHIAKSLGVPFIYEVRGFWELTSLAEGNSDTACTSWAEKETRMMAAADAVITLSDTMKHELISRGVDSTAIHIVGNSVDPKIFNATATGRGLRARMKLRGRYVVGIITRVRKLEGIDCLIHAVAELIRTGIPASALIVGDGPDVERLRTFSRELGVSRHVHFAGRVPHRKVRRYYSIIDVFVVPRRDDEVSKIVSPLKPLEAMAMGLPLVVSNLPALVDIVRSGRCGETFCPGRPKDLARVLDGLYRNPDKRRRMGESGRTYVLKERTWEHAAHSTAAIYDFAREKFEHGITVKGKQGSAI